MRYVAPLTDFVWEGGSCKLSDDLQISEREAVGNVESQLDNFSESDKAVCSLSQRGLVFDRKETEKLKPSELINLFLLALWIAKPSTAFVPYRFSVNNPEESARMLDRFLYVKIPEDNRISNSDLDQASGYLATLRKSTEDSPRANVAILLTLAGCFCLLWFRCGSHAQLSKRARVNRTTEICIRCFREFGC